MIGSVFNEKVGQYYLPILPSVLPDRDTDHSINHLSLYSSTKTIMAIISKLMKEDWLQGLTDALKALNLTVWADLSPIKRKLLLTGSVVTAGIASVYIYDWLRTPRNLPPGPRGIPLIGSPHLISENYYLDYTRFGQQYGDVFSFYLFNR